MLRYGHGAGGVHLTRYTANLTGKEQSILCKERTEKQREEARKGNTGQKFIDKRTIELRKKIHHLRISIQQIKKSNINQTKKEEKIKAKLIQIKKINEQLNDAEKKISYYKETDKEGNIIEEITDEYGYKRTKKNGHIVKIEKLKYRNIIISNDNPSTSSKAQNNQPKKRLKSQKKQQICKDCIFIELISLHCKIFHNSCSGKKCGKYKKSRGLYGIVQ